MPNLVVHKQLIYMVTDTIIALPLHLFFFFLYIKPNMKSGCFLKPLPVCVNLKQFGKKTFSIIDFNQWKAYQWRQTWQNVQFKRIQGLIYLHEKTFLIETFQLWPL